MRYISYTLLCDLQLSKLDRDVQYHVQPWDQGRWQTDWCSKYSRRISYYCLIHWSQITWCRYHRCELQLYSTSKTRFYNLKIGHFQEWRNLGICKHLGELRGGFLCWTSGATLRERRRVRISLSPARYPCVFSLTNAQNTGNMPEIRRKMCDIPDKLHAKWNANDFVLLCANEAS